MHVYVDNFFKFWYLGLPQKSLEGHDIPRLMRISLLLGKIMGFAKEEVELLVFGACLYDIGKLFLPPYLLKREDLLDPGENELFNLHAVLGAGFLLLSGFHPKIVEVARYHHENWDGSGYPEGLRKDQIPVFARLIRVIDTLDALLVQRARQDAISEAEVLKKIEKKSGSFFDPEIVDLLPRVLAIH